MELLRQQCGHYDGNGDKGGSDDCACRQRQEASAYGIRGPAGREQTPEHESDEKIDDEQRHLITAQHNAGSDNARSGTVDDRPARQRPLQAHHGDRHVCEAQHLADVLDAPGHGGAVTERERGDETAGPMPALVAEPQHEGGAAGKHHGQNRRIDGPQAGSGGEQRQQEEGGEKIIAWGSAI